MEDDKVTLNIPTYEILLVIGIIGTIIGILAPFQRIEFLGITFWFDPRLVYICVPVGVGLICGYITRKILPSNKNAYWVGFLLGIIGIVVVICIRPTNSTINNTSNSNKNKYVDLERLAELKQSGILTEEEFEIEKTKILKGE